VTEASARHVTVPTDTHCGSCETPPADAARRVGDSVWTMAARRTRQLAWASLAWMTAEGALGLYAGYHAKSVALIGWAFGSVVEGLASIIVIWRLTGARTLSDTAERRAQQAVAISFWVLAPYIAAQAVADLVSGTHPATTALGIALTATSLAVMPGLGAAKHRLARRLDSGATAGEGTQNYLCAAQGAAVLAALAVTAIWAAGWWVDPAIALVLAGWAVREGVETWNGQDCC
jgi:divalent metal cation (Fe/Co/Zn/Cd) transporter